MSVSSRTSINPPESEDGDSITGGSREDGDSTDSKVAIPRHLGLWGCVWHTIGNIIGTGIFISPSGILRGTGGSVGLALIFWPVCGLIQTCGSFVYAELAVMIKKSGGELTFLHDAYGPAIAFLKLWIIVFFLTAGSAITAIIIPEYMLTPFFPCSDPPILAVRFMGICVVLFLVGINCVSVQGPTRFAGFFTITKTIGLIIIITSGMYNLATGHTTYLANGFSTGTPSLKLLPIAFYAGTFAYGGWDVVAALTEEIKQPKRNIPLSLVISMTIIIIVYVLTNVAYFTLLSPEEVLNSPAIAADYSVKALGRWSWLIWFFVSMSAMGALNSTIYKRGRQLFALAREGVLPEIAAMLNVNYLTPIPATFVTLIGLIYLIEEDIFSIIAYVGFVENIFDTMTVAILPYYRWKYPNREREFKCPLVLAIIYMCGQVLVAVLAFYLDPVKKSIGLAVVLTGLPFYFAFYHPRYKLKQEWVKKSSVKLTRFLQKLFNCVHQEKRTF
ncbi:cystine/glutamate transporter-like [Lytechinus variegatus]|uniref:cystine/glutamate transporter-like n=1 Tax=Lytechinus variegatus TaxID=7654 RepID=UPI001BB12C90|nr:cystine/glutamate transporter-like [Lytechinus variegatus]